MVVRLVIGSSQSAWEIFTFGLSSIPWRGVGDSLWAESAERLSAVVWDSVPASAAMRVNSGDA